MLQPESVSGHTSTAGLQQSVFNCMLHLLCRQLAADEADELPTADVALLC